MVYELNTTKKFGRNERKGDIHYLVNAIYKDKVIEFSLTDEKGKTVMYNLCSRTIAPVYNSGDRAKLARQLIKIFNESQGKTDIKKAEKFANKSTTSNRKKAPKPYIVLEENRPIVKAEMYKRLGKEVFDEKMYETVAKEMGLWVKNPNA